MNKANRQVCDLDIRVLKTMAPFLFFDTANTTTFGFTSEDTFANAKGAKKIAFSNPGDGTMSVEAQIKPFKLYALLSDGSVDTEAVVAERKIIRCTEAGKLTLPAGIQPGSVFVYKEGEWGQSEINGNVSELDFNAAAPTDLLVDASYEVGYLISKTTGVHKIEINNQKNPQDYFISMNTVEKDEDGMITPYKITVFKAKPKKSIELSFSSDGDPASVKIEFTCLEDKEGRVAEMVEETE